MNALWRDLRYALRLLAKNPGFATVAVLTLALGIGANTTIFSVVYGVILRPLPYPESDRIMQLAWEWRGQLGRGITDLEFENARQHTRSFERMAAETGAGFNLATGSDAARVRGEYVSEDYFRLLGGGPAVGRDFTRDEHQIGSPRVVILSDALWRTRFGASRDVLGQTIQLDQVPFTIVGVAPASFYTPARVDLWTPLWPVKRTIGGGGNYTVLARLRPGVNPVQARDELKAFIAEFRRSRGQTKPTEETLGAIPYQKSLTFDVQKPLLILFGAIGFVLLIACANLANLTLARAVGRTREVAIRTALGASRSKLFRQMVTESVVLALLGGAVGLLGAVWGTDVLLSLTPADLLPLERIHLDFSALGFTFLISLGTGILFGVAPAFQATRADPNAWLKESSGRTTSGLVRGHLHNVLAVAEVALSLILLTGAGLLIQTFSNLVRVDPGFDLHRVLSVQAWSTGARYKTMPELTGYYREIETRLAMLPGVEAVGVVAAGLPLDRGGNTNVRMTSPSDPQTPSVDFRVVTPDYFRALGERLLQGRAFTDADSATAAPVAIINESFAREFFRDRNPIGQRFWTPEDPVEVVGVVSNVKSNPAWRTPPTFFIPFQQAPFNVVKLFEGWFPTTILVRTAADPAALALAVERTVKETDAMVPVGSVRAMEAVFSAAVASQRFNMVLLGMFAALGLLLSAVGVYGVISNSVAQRTHEIGVRIALGAQPGDVLRLVVRQGLVLTGVGIVFGLAGAFWLVRFLAMMLFNVAPRDPFTFAAVALLLAFVALLACVVPAWRAAKVDPMVALRYE